MYARVIVHRLEALQYKFRIRIRIHLQVDFSSVASGLQTALIVSHFLLLAKSTIGKDNSLDLALPLSNPKGGNA